MVSVSMGGVFVKPILLFAGTVGTKILLTKAVAVGLLLLTFALKGRALHRSEEEWNTYILSLNDRFVLRYATVIYVFSAVLASFGVYALLTLFHVPHPLFCSMALAILCAGITGFRFFHDKKALILQKFQEVTRFVRAEQCSET